MLASEDHPLTDLRLPAPNTNVSTFSLAQLLWREEALEELRKLGVHRGLNRAARHYVWLRLAQVTTLDQLRRTVILRIKARNEWPGGQTAHEPG